MVYAALTNWKYDKKLYHAIQSGPQRTGNQLDLTDTYKVVSSGYVIPGGTLIPKFQQTTLGVDYEGTDFGIVRAGPPNALVPTILNPPDTTITVGVYNDGLTGNRFYFDLVRAPEIIVTEKATYIFDQSDPTNTSHQIAFSETPDGTFGGGTVYTDGVTVEGIPGQPGARTILTVSSEAPQYLYYFSLQTPNYGDRIDVNPSFITAQWDYSDDWRQVPPTISGYWTDYTDYPLRASGLLTAYEGYRGATMITVAGRQVRTTYGFDPGLKDIGPYTWFGASVPDNQFYNPFWTPEQEPTSQGSTGGPGTYERVLFPMLTNPTNDSSGSRAAWRYHQPVYCQTFVETVRSTFENEPFDENLSL